MTKRLPLSVRETLRAARITASVPVIHGVSLAMIGEAERWMRAGVDRLAELDAEVARLVNRCADLDAECDRIQAIADELAEQ